MNSIKVKNYENSMGPYWLVGEGTEINSCTTNVKSTVILENDSFSKCNYVSHKIDQIGSENVGNIIVIQLFLECNNNLII